MRKEGARTAVAFLDVFDIEERTMEEKCRAWLNQDMCIVTRLELLEAVVARQPVP